MENKFRRGRWTGTIFVIHSKDLLIFSMGLHMFIMSIFKKCPSKHDDMCPSKRDAMCLSKHEAGIKLELKEKLKFSDKRCN